MRSSATIGKAFGRCGLQAFATFDFRLSTFDFRLSTFDFRRSTFDARVANLADSTRFDSARFGIRHASPA
ncbi:hypothetical protein WS72_06205 [Burkholderia savannae]|uniref:Pentapeptide repeat-containing protein n=1 Tax=Burkholderia savannae TaxID=1637837 RepID=A0ABR5TD74_9BURK|nr:hypothetical protein WS72_06205 [Burkholderia savannae]